MRPVSWRNQNVENTGISAPFEKVSERNNTLHVFNTNDKIRNNFPGDISELSVPGSILTGNHTLITTEKIHTKYRKK